MPHVNCAWRKPGRLQVGAKVGVRVDLPVGFVVVEGVPGQVEPREFVEACEAQRHVLVDADTPWPQQPEALSEGGAPGPVRDLVHHVVGDDEVETTVGEAGRGHVHLVEVHARAERLGARVRVAKHAGPDVDAVHVRLGKGQRVRHRRRAGRAGHVEGPPRDEVRIALAQEALDMGRLAVAPADALAEGIQVAAGLIVGACHDVVRPEVERIAAGLQMHFHLRHATRRHERRVEFERPAATALPREARRGRREPRALAGQRVRERRPHEFLGAARERGPGPVVPVGQHALADFAPPLRRAAVFLLVGRRDLLLEGDAVARPQRPVQVLLEGDDEALAGGLVVVRHCEHFVLDAPDHRHALVVTVL